MKVSSVEACEGSLVAEAEAEALSFSQSLNEVAKVRDSGAAGLAAPIKGSTDDEAAKRAARGLKHFVTDSMVVTT